MTYKTMRTMITVFDFSLIVILCFSIGNILVTGECSIATSVCNAFIAVMWVFYGWYMYCKVDEMRKIIDRM